MRSWLVGVTAAVCAAVIGPAASARAQQPSYVITDLGPARTSSCALAGPFLNQAGQAVKTYASSNVAGSIRTYFIDSDGSQTDVGTLFGFDTLGQAVNAHGVVSGWSATGIDDSSFHAFIWTRAQGIRDIGLGSSNASCGMNARGDVVGTSYDSHHAWVYTGGQTFDLNELTVQGGAPWASFQDALSINDAGQIFGTGFISGVRHAFVMSPAVQNLLTNAGFEQSLPPAAGPGWVADASRQVLAKSETNQPHTGLQNGACWATDYLDCGMYEDLTAPSTGTYTFTVYANADRGGGFVGANVNGVTVAWQAVDVRGFGNYGSAYTMTFTASQGDAVRVWMYSPATPGYIVIDDASLTVGP